MRAARRIRRFGDVRVRGRRGGARGDFRRRRLRNANAGIHFEVLFGAAWAEGFPGIFIAQARELIAAMDTIAIAGRGSRFDGHECHRLKILRSG